MAPFPECALIFRVLKVALYDGRQKMKEAKGYRERVREAIQRRDGEPILNGSINHAGVIVAEAFNAANECISLLSYKLDQGCYDEAVRNSAKAFLADPDHRAKILVESSLWDPEGNFEWDNHPFIEALRTFVGEGEDARLQIRLVPEDWTKRYSFNFLILDDYGFRFEADRAKAAAVAAFYAEGSEGATKDVQHLQGIFDDLWAVSAPLKLKKAN